MAEILIQHKNIPVSGRHAPHSYEYPTEADRLAATGFGVGDLHKLAVQLDNGTIWRLRSVNPVLWSKVGGKVTWQELENKPDKFVPVSHTHTPDEVGTYDVVDSAIANLKAEDDPFPQYATEAEVLAIAEVKSVAGKKGVVTLEITDIQGLNSAIASKAPIEHISDVNNPHKVTKEQLGLSNVDNTSDANKPISNAVQDALNTKSDKEHTHTVFEVAGAVRSVNGKYPDANGAVTIDAGGAGGEEFQRFKKRNYFGIKILES